MKNNNQTYYNFKTKKLFDTCKLEGRWKHMDNSVSSYHIVLEDGASIELSIMDANFTESFRFKKNSNIKIRDSIAEFHEENLFR